MLFFGLGIGGMARLFTKFTHRLILAEFGKVLRIERYPAFGFGHMRYHTVYPFDIQGISAYSKSRWSPFRFGKGFYKLEFKRNWLGRTITDYAIFTMKGKPDLDILKLLAIGRPVTNKTLHVLKKAKKQV